MRIKYQENKLTSGYFFYLLRINITIQNKKIQFFETKMLTTTKEKFFELFLRTYLKNSLKSFQI